MVSVAILGVTACGGIGAFTFLNRYASSLRNVSSAKALCQERIEQAISQPFNPPVGVPSVPAAKSGYGPFSILGTSANWAAATATAPYNNSTPLSSTAAAAGIQTSTEPVDVYVQQDGGSATAVTGTRTTKITYMSATPTGVTFAVPTVLFTVQVSYTFRDKPYTYSMSTLRTFDNPKI